MNGQKQEAVFRCGGQPHFHGAIFCSIRSAGFDFPQFLELLSLRRLFLAIPDGRGLLIVFPLFPLPDDALFFHLAFKII
jgi:hypothetical protein